MVGIATGDDAAVYKLNDHIAIVQTVDFFPPIVDDPYTYGAISAANSISDIYAMGARPITAMNIVAFPRSQPRDVLREILRGAAEKAKEAGVPIVGGHTIDDEEPKFGMAVTGVVHPGHEITNAGAKVGDMLVLTKPIGTGIITTALKAGKAPKAAYDEAARHMLTLNKAASEAMLEVGVHACTDVTGFGLLGHLRGMMRASKAAANISFAAVPLMAGAWQLGVEQEIGPGGTTRNRDFCDQYVTWDKAVPAKAWRLLYDPQTSGGLLIAVAKGKLKRLLAGLKAKDVEGSVTGEVTSGAAGTIKVVA